MDLLIEWSRWKPDSTPYLLEADRPAILSRTDRWTVMNWQERFSTSDFGVLGDRRLHLGLLPHPFCGDLRNASIYVLMLNPGLGLQDYYGEFEVPEFRKALLKNLAQDFSEIKVPFLFLDPRFAWHGGYGWWHGKLVRVIEQLAATHSLSFAEACSRLATRLASIELIPYHSVSFDDTGGLSRKLPSAQLARSFVSEHVVPRVRSGDAIAIVTRKSRIWDLAEMPGVIIYDKSEARGAHLGPKSRGGQAILQHLAKRF